MYGCKYCKMNKQNNEYCTLTGAPTNGAVMCDFEWEDCPDYQKALQPIKHAEQSGCSSMESKLIQTSIYGTAGEKVFKG